MGRGIKNLKNSLKFPFFERKLMNQERIKSVGDFLGWSSNTSAWETAFGL